MFSVRTFSRLKCQTKVALEQPSSKEALEISNEALKSASESGLFILLKTEPYLDNISIEKAT